MLYLAPDHVEPVSEYVKASLTGAGLFDPNCATSSNPKP